MKFSCRIAGVLLLILSLLLLPGQRDGARSRIKTIHPTFTTIDVPGAGYTNVSAINAAGDMVGSYGSNTSTDAHGFRYSEGIFTYFDYPKGDLTVPMGINDSGLIVGHAGQDPVIGFLYDGKTFVNLRDGKDSAVFSDGINDAGAIVGGAGTIYTTKGFRMLNGTYKTVRFPGSYVYAAATAINNLDQMAGWTSSPEHGYVIHSNGQFQSVDFPGAFDTTAWGINDSSVVVGWYFASSCGCAFAYRNGEFVSFGYPGASSTGATGISASGEVVGEYTFDDHHWHGFVTGPVTAADFQ